ncbi:MAG TPA: GNAT family N-acetyltransferase [Cytophagales bacterium]|nr:GNAT family N-acetyltransferase [Cytophagales bacterium]HAA22778.1 GNAT family N-acetyltransferase [Cytophagales bacterium]HAP62778.1 GNAT family N-acetyltransferase [Cytophagales bacterium]
MSQDALIRSARPEECAEIGELMVEVYSQLEGFPSPDEMPSYYNLLRNVGQWMEKPKVELLVAVLDSGVLGGAVVYFHDMKDYGSGGTATQEQNACGFRLLAVPTRSRGMGIGKLLTEHCIRKGQESPAQNLVIHTTQAMQQAWGMYERLGFQRAEDLDFMQGQLPVFGFRLALKK